MAVKKVMETMDMALNQIINHVLHKIAWDAWSPVEWQVWFNTSAWFMKYEDSVWTKIVASQAWVLALRIDQLQAPTSAVSWNNQRLTNLGTPSSTNDAVTKQYVDDLVNGNDWKDNVRALANSNVTLSGLQTIDGISLADGDRVLLTWQTDASENGIYVVASGAWSRSEDANSDAKVTASLAVFVSEGTSYADTQWRLTTDDTIVLDTTNLTFTQFGGSTTYTWSDTIDVTWTVISVNTTKVATKVTATIGDGSSTEITVNHNLNSRDIVYDVTESASPYSSIICGVEKVDVNNIKFTFASAPSTNEYTVIIIW